VAVPWVACVTCVAVKLPRPLVSLASTPGVGSFKVVFSGVV